MTLWDLSKNTHATIISFFSELDNTIATRLLEMGFESNQTVFCIRRSPLSGPIVIQLGDSVFSLEQEIAQHIFIQEI